MTSTEIQLVITAKRWQKRWKKVKKYFRKHYPEVDKALVRGNFKRVYWTCCI